MRTARRLIFVCVVFAVAWLGARSLTGVIVAPASKPAAKHVARRSLGTQFLTTRDAQSGLHGTVSAQAAGPLHGAVVCAAWRHDDLIAGRAPFCTKSDEHGRYELAELPAGSYRVTATAEGYAPGGLGDGHAVRLVDGRRTSADIILTPGGAIVSGTVVDATGGVVPNAQVRAVRLLDPAVALQVESDQEGRFRLSVPAGLVGLFASAEGYAQGSTSYVAPSRDAEIVLTPESAVAGTVVSAKDGEPVADVEVRALSAETPNPALYRAARSDEDGKFKITGLAQGPYLLQARGGRYHGELAQPVEVAVGERVSDLTVVVQEGSELRGRVLLEDGKTPCPEGHVLLGAPDPELHQTPANANLDGVGPQQFARIEPDGQVYFEGLLPAFYYVTVDCSGNTLKRGPSSLYIKADDRIPDPTWTVTAAASVKVRVVDGRGTPLPHETFDLLRQSESGVTEMTLKTGEHGELVMRGLPAGEYDVLAPGGPDRGESTHVTLRAGQQVEAVLRLRGTGAIEITATLRDGRPVDKLTVSAHSVPAHPAPVENKPFSDARRLVYAEPLGHGKYRINGLLEGRYELTADDQINPPLRAPSPVVVAAGTSQHVAFSMSREGEIRGRVSDERGEPMPNVWVSARASAGPDAPKRLVTAAGGKRVLSDVNGDFTLDGLAPDGRYTVSASESYGSTVVQRDVTSGAQLSLRLPAPASIAGKAVDASGAPCTAFSVHAVSASGSVREQRVYASDGAFSLRGVSPGPVRLEVYTLSGKRGTQSLQLSSGQKLTNVRVVAAELPTDNPNVASLP